MVVAMISGPFALRRVANKAFDKYEIQEKIIGEGTFAKVQVATHRLTGRDVAMKFINKRKMEDTKAKNKIEREVSNLRKVCSHPHIIDFYEVIDTPPTTILITELATRGELINYANHHEVGSDEARRFFQQIISGVEHCHSQNIAHRDLKLENVLLDKDLNVKICDFGLSTTFREDEFLLTACGSPSYAAPELIKGNKYKGPDVDTWSCGVILYGLLCKVLPFNDDDDDIPRLFQLIKKGIYSLPDHLTSMETDLIKGLLVVNPIERMTLRDVRQHPWFCNKVQFQEDNNQSPTDSDNFAIRESKIGSMDGTGTHIAMPRQLGPCISDSVVQLKPRGDRVKPQHQTKSSDASNSPPACSTEVHRRETFKSKIYQLVAASSAQQLQPKSCQSPCETHESMPPFHSKALPLSLSTKNTEAKIVPEHSKGPWATWKVV